MRNRARTHLDRSTSNSDYTAQRLASGVVAAYRPLSPARTTGYSRAVALFVLDRVLDLLHPQDPAFSIKLNHHSIYAVIDWRFRVFLNVRCGG